MFALGFPAVVSVVSASFVGLMVFGSLFFFFLFWWEFRKVFLVFFFCAGISGG
jgi:hypothetical protein